MFTYTSITQFQQHVDLKDYRRPTKKEYVRNVRKLAEHFQCDPAGLTENQVREYFLFLRQHKHYKHSAMKAAKSAAALQDVARDHKDLGADVGLLAVLQTWTRDLRFHPHVHCVVPGGGLSADGLRWVRPKSPGYFLPQQLLALRLRTRLKQALQENHPRLFVQIPRRVWFRDWVADVQPVGSGEPALKYLAAYIYRTALPRSGTSLVLFWLPAPNALSPTMASTSPSLTATAPRARPALSACRSNSSFTASSSMSCPEACNVSVTLGGSRPRPRNASSGFALCLITQRRRSKSPRLCLHPNVPVARNR